MRWGFGWELGPFETADAIGIDRVIDAAREVDADLLADGAPAIWRPTLDSGGTRLRSGEVPPAAADLLILRAARDRSKVVKKNPGASLVDLGDGVLAVEFHSKMNAIGGDTIQMLQAGVREAETEFRRAGRRQRGHALLCRREPDARAPRGAGGELGRARSDGANVPADARWRCAMRVCR